MTTKVNIFNNVSNNLKNQLQRNAFERGKVDIRARFECCGLCLDDIEKGL